MRALPLCALLAACSFTADDGGSAYLCGPDGACPAGQTCVDGRCVTGGTGADAAPPPSSWWDEAWRARHPLAIENAADQALPAGFQVGWSVDLDVEFGEGELDSIRLVAYEPDADRWTELPYVDDGAGSGGNTVWFPLPAALEPGRQSVIWIYLDNPAAAPADWDGNDVFEMSDSFSELSVDRWVWTGAVVDEGTAIRFDETAEMRSAEPWPVDRAVDIVARVSDSASRLWLGFQREVPDLMPDVPWLVWIRREPGNAMYPEYAGPDDTFDSRWVGSNVGVGADEHVFTVERASDRVVYRLDYRVANDDHDHPLDKEHSAPLFIRFSNTSASSFWLRRVRVRQTAYPAPEAALGAREELSAP